MDDLSEVLGSFLSDPEKLSQIASLAEGLGLTQPSAAQEDVSPVPSENTMKPAMLSSMLQLAEEAGRQDPRQLALLNALRPFLRPERRKDIDRALKAAQLSRLAGLALRTLHEEKEP